MLGISIDLGTYSVKFLNFRLDRKKIRFLHADEIIIDYHAALAAHESNGEKEEHHLFKNQLLWQLQIKVIKEYLSNIDSEYHFLMNIPSELVSTRLLKIPVKSKKKASLMLPFQIEEDLPYALSTCHYAESIEVIGGTSHALVGIIKKEHFKLYFNDLVLKHLTPKALTYNSSVFENYVRENKSLLPKAFCIIELGHTGTRGFYFLDAKLVSVHQSYIAGHSINEAISKEYNIPLDEAILYKHQNSYLLTPEQYDQVNQNQKDFAELMDNTLNPLINDINRWNIGFRVKFHTNISEVFTCGGSANIKNLNNYIEYKTKLKVALLDVFNRTDLEAINQDASFCTKFTQAAAMAQTTTKKSKLVNFLHGEFNLQEDSDLPIPNMVFIATRVAILAIIICSSLVIEGFFLSKDIKLADKVVASYLKNPTLNINGRLRRSAKKNPQKLISKLKKRNKRIEQEVKTIQSAIRTNALSSLNFIISQISGNDVEIITFHSLNDGDFKMTLSAENLKDLEKLNDIFVSTKDSEITSRLNLKKKILTLTGEEAK